MSERLKKLVTQLDAEEAELSGVGCRLHLLYLATKRIDKDPGRLLKAVFVSFSLQLAMILNCIQAGTEA